MSGDELKTYFYTFSIDTDQQGLYNYDERSVDFIDQRQMLDKINLAHDKHRSNHEHAPLETAHSVDKLFPSFPTFDEGVKVSWEFDDGQGDIGLDGFVVVKAEDEETAIETAYEKLNTYVNKKNGILEDASQGTTAAQNPGVQEDLDKTIQK